VYAGQTTGVRVCYKPVHCLWEISAASSVMRFAAANGAVAVDSVDLGTHVRYSLTIPEFARHGAVLLALGLLVCTACPLGAGEVYKSVDAEGHVVYSDRADASGAQKSVVRSDPPNATEAARLAKEQEIQKAEGLQRSRQKLIEDTKKAQQDQAKQAQCESARNRYYSLKDARRIFDLDAAGNRVFYSDAEAETKREEARQAMTAACGT
jgi:Domain of unknown function (DUF4124)